MFHTEEKLRGFTTAKNETTKDYCVDCLTVVESKIKTTELEMNRIALL